jgi:hypothetical protein
MIFGDKHQMPAAKLLPCGGRIGLGRLHGLSAPQSAIFLCGFNAPRVSGSEKDQIAQCGI